MKRANFALLPLAVFVAGHEKQWSVALRLN